MFALGPEIYNFPNCFFKVLTIQWWRLAKLNIVIYFLITRLLDLVEMQSWSAVRDDLMCVVVPVHSSLWNKSNVLIWPMAGRQSFEAGKIWDYVFFFCCNRLSRRQDKNCRRFLQTEHQSRIWLLICPFTICSSANSVLLFIRFRVKYVLRLWWLLEKGFHWIWKSTANTLLCILNDSDF